MFNYIKEIFDMDENIVKIVHFGFKLSICICIVAIVSILIYYKYYISHDLYEVSILLFKTSLLYAIQFLICGIAINKIYSDNK